MTKYEEQKTSLYETNESKFLKFRENLVEGISNAYHRNPKANKYDFERSVKYLEDFGFFDKPSLKEGKLADIKRSSGFTAFKSKEEAEDLASSLKDQAVQEILDYVEEQFYMFAQECQQDSAAELSVDRGDNSVTFLLNGSAAFSFNMPQKALKYARWTNSEDGDSLGEVVSDEVFAEDLASGKVANCTGYEGQVFDFMFNEKAIYAYYLVVTDFQRTWGFAPGDSSISTPIIWKGDSRKSPYSGYITALCFISDAQAILYSDVSSVLPSVDDLFDRIKYDNTLLNSFDSIPSSTKDPL